MEEKIQAHLETLREEREKLLGFKVTGEGKSQKYLIQTQTERQKIVSEFQQLQQFLQKQEQVLLAALENLEKEIVKIQNDNVTKLSEKISCLSNQISELEGSVRSQQVNSCSDFRSTLSRCKKGKFQQPVEISPELEKRLSDFSQKIIAVMEILRKFKDTLCCKLETERGKLLGSFRPEEQPQQGDAARKGGERQFLQPPQQLTAAREMNCQGISAWSQALRAEKQLHGLVV
ncbi:unnamed protein product [Eretmochelys imbricata]